jgi:phage/plasmid primase-like uncharacterized protein
LLYLVKIKIKIKMSKFWEQQEWLDKVKNMNVDFYNHIKNGKNIEMDWTTFSLIIDGVKHELILTDDKGSKSEITIIDENGAKNTFIR